MSLTGTVRELCVPLADYPHVQGNASLRDVFAKLHASCGRAELFRSILVLDDSNRLLGMMGLKDLLHALMPDYLRRDTMHFQGTTGDLSALAILWQEDCAEQIRAAARICVRDHVVPIPAVIGPDEPMSKAVFLFATLPIRILPVVEGKEMTGVLRLVDVLDQVVVEVLSERSAP